MPGTQAAGREAATAAIPDNFNISRLETIPR
jgi:hypothetical protein